MQKHPNAPNEIRRPLIHSLENRVLFSAAPAPAEATEAPAPESAPPQESETPSAENAPAANVPETQTPAPAESVVPPPAAPSEAVSIEEVAAQTMPEATENLQGDLAEAAEIVNEMQTLEFTFISNGDLEALQTTALEHWQTAGATAEQLETLQQATYRVENLGGNILGMAQGFEVVIDDDGAGMGWDLHAPQTGDSGYDLLTTLLHEQGHVLGLQDNYSDPANLMYATLGLNEQRLPSYGLASGAQAGSITTPSLLTATASVPGSNAIDVAQNGTITITFDESVTDLNDGVTVTGNLQGDISFASSISGNVVTLTPDASYLPGEIIEVDVTDSVLGTTTTVPFSFQFTAIAETGDGIFTSHWTEQEESNSSHVTLGDFNGDGFPDAAVTQSFPNEVWIRLNDGAGNFDTISQKISTEIPDVGSGDPGDVQAADFNNDGIVDLFIANRGGGGGVDDRVYLGNGDGTFTAFSEFNSDFGTNAGAVGDLNQDGFLDIVVVGSSNISIFYNDGAGGFSDGVGTSTLFTSSFGAVDVELADFNNDGILDLVFLDPNTNGGIFAFTNNGSGSFSPTTGGNLTGTDFSGFELGDVNGDNYIDAIIAGENGSVVFLNLAGAGFSTSTSIATTNAYNVALGDVDSDGDLDAIFAANTFNGGVNQVFLNTGGTFTNSGQTLGNRRSVDVGAADLNGDGAIDIYFANRLLFFEDESSDGGRDRVWINTISTTPPTNPPGNPDPPSGSDPQPTTVPSVTFPVGNGGTITFTGQDEQTVATGIAQPVIEVLNTLNSFFVDLFTLYGVDEVSLISEPIRQDGFENIYHVIVKFLVNEREISSYQLMTEYHNPIVGDFSVDMANVKLASEDEKIIPGGFL